MNSSLFASRLTEASLAALALARRHVADALPAAIRYHVSGVAIELEPLVARLWRDGAVPAWVNLVVESADAEATTVAVTACERQVADDAGLLHASEGRPPFHVLAPPAPPASMHSAGEPFSLRWRSEVRDPAALARLLAHGDQVRMLSVTGLWCDDEALATLRACSRLVTLVLQGTAVTGAGLAALVGHAALEYLSLTAVTGAVQLAGVAGLPRLKSIHVDGTPTELTGVDRLAELAHLTDVELKVRALDDLDFVASLAQLERLSVSSSRISSLAPLRHRQQLHHLDLSATNVADDQIPYLAPLSRLRVLELTSTLVTDTGAAILASLPSLHQLWLTNTLVTDSALDAFATAGQLTKLDVRGTHVTLDGIGRLARSRPDLQITADGWTPRRRTAPVLDTVE